MHTKTPRRGRSFFAICSTSLMMLIPSAVTGQPISSQPVAAPVRSFADHQAAVQRLVAANPTLVKSEKLAESYAKREISVLTVAAAGDVPPEKRLGILIVGGIDADAPAAADAAVAVVEQLLATAAKDAASDVATLLKQRVLYVVPRLNPDGIEMLLEPVRRGDRTNARPIDNDRDGATDEDGPNDLNKDGVITVMRVRDSAGEWLPDKDEPRLLKRAERAKGERGIYRLISEGIDDDNDGEINEDGPGGVDEGRNWPHLFESGVSEAGIHALSEPANRALAAFVIAHRNIAAAIVYGRNDNIVNVPKGAARGPSGQDYRDLHPDDVTLFESLSDKYKEISGLKAGPGASPDGALYSWLYAQQGIPTFATALWWLPEPAVPVATSAPASGPATTPETAADAAPADSTSPPDPERPRGGRGARGGRGGSPGGDSGPPPGGGRRGGRGGSVGPAASGGSSGGAADGSASSGDSIARLVENTDANKKWLKYSDETLNKAGFIEWQAVDHPTLVRVEVGGFAPNLRFAPRAADATGISERQATFVAELSKLLPTPKFLSPRVKHLGGGLWRVEVRLVNESLMPTHPAIARHIRIPSFTLAPQLPPDRIIGGGITERIANLPGGGEAQKRGWIIRGPAGEKVTFRAFQRTFGELSTAVELKETTPGQED